MGQRLHTLRCIAVDYPPVCLPIPKEVLTGALALHVTELTTGAGTNGMAGVDLLVPKMVKGLKKQTFVRVACGATHTLALTASGQVRTTACANLSFNQDVDGLDS